MDYKKNPILFYISGIPVRKTNQISISLNEMEMRRVIEVSVDTGLSIPNIIALQGKPCQACGNDNIVIPKGIIQERKKKGATIVQQKIKKGKK